MISSNRLRGLKNIENLKTDRSFSYLSHSIENHDTGSRQDFGLCYARGDALGEKQPIYDDFQEPIDRCIAAPVPISN